MTTPVTPRRPGDTLWLADLALVMAGTLLGVSATLLIAGRGLAGVGPAALVPGSWLAGLVLARLHPHPFRILGMVPIAATATLVFALAGQLGLGWPAWLATLIALTQGVTLGAILRYRGYQKSHPVRLGLAAVLGVAGATGVVGLAGSIPNPSEFLGWPLVSGTAVLAFVGWAGFARHAVEVMIEPGMRTLYHCRRAGPGTDKVPRTGPVLVIANHAAWFDPVFVADSVHRETAPMMTAGFYDLPFMSWLMRRVFRVIRVAETATRRDVPEIRQAVEALDAGQCVVIFPEGYLRRKDDSPLRRFGRGVWQILKDRPDTPVVACWVEGSWGSYFSHFNGPPTKNKRFDFRRRIRVGMGEPVLVPPEVLAEHLTTRLWLMQRVIDARRHLDLEPLTGVDLPAE